MKSTTPENLATNCIDIEEPSSTLEGLMYASPNNPQDTRRRHPLTTNKAVTILPRPTLPVVVKAIQRPSMNPSAPDSIQVSAVVSPSTVKMVSVQAATARETGAVQRATFSDTPHVRCPVNKLGSRKMTHEVEEQVLSAWGLNVDAYFDGIRRRVFKKIALQLNEIIPEAPYFTEKQVENKITYMEKRYRTVKEKYGASGYRVDDLSEAHLRTQVERTFPLFFKVHQVIGSRAATDVTEDGSNLLQLEDRRGRKRKRTDNSDTAGEAENDNISSPAGPLATDVLEDSGNAADDNDAGSNRSPEENANLTKNKEDAQEIGKRLEKKHATYHLTEVMLKTMCKQVESEGKYHNDILQVMRSELEVNKALLETQRTTSQQNDTLAKVQEMRKVAELYISLDEKAKAQAMLDEVTKLLTTP